MPLANNATPNGIITPRVDLLLDVFSGTGSSVGTTSTVVLPGTVDFHPQYRNSNIMITIADLSGETIAISATTSDGVAVSAANMRVTKVSDGNDIAPTTLGNGSYYIKMIQIPHLRTLTFTKSAAVGPVRVAVAQAFAQYTAL